MTTAAAGAVPAIALKQKSGKRVLNHSLLASPVTSSVSSRTRVRQSSMMCLSEAKRSRSSRRMTRNKRTAPANHQNPSRPRFKRGEQDLAYQAITALKIYYPDLKMEVMPQFSSRRFKVVLERYLLNLPLNAVAAHPHVMSAPLREGHSHEAGAPHARRAVTAQAKPGLLRHLHLTIGSLCQQCNHLQEKCEHSVRCQLRVQYLEVWFDKRLSFTALAERDPPLAPFSPSSAWWITSYTPTTSIWKSSRISDISLLIHIKVGKMGIVLSLSLSLSLSSLPSSNSLFYSLL